MRERQGPEGELRRPSRLRALAELEANAESSAKALDRIARTACRVLDVPVVLVNLVGAEQQHFVGCEGPEPWASMREMPITAGFCPFAVGANDTFALGDARTDPSTAANPAVEQFGVVAYAGVPLRATDGEPVGTLCAIDYEPRPLERDRSRPARGACRRRDRGAPAARGHPAFGLASRRPGGAHGVELRALGDRRRRRGGRRRDRSAAAERCAGRPADRRRARVPRRGRRDRRAGAPVIMS